MNTTSNIVKVIYTGGTIGSKPRDPDPDSPQVVVPWDELKEATPEIERLGFEVDCYPLSEPLDSCNVGPDQWREIAKAIQDDYNRCLGFVILHGTDTLVYTASALSFMLRNLAKPVVVTGAQRSAMVGVRNDATQNFITALQLASGPASGLPILPEVCISFGGEILRGNRGMKVHTSGYSAYESPNWLPLGNAGDKITINGSVTRPLPDPRKRTFRVAQSLETNVTTIFMYPGIQDSEIVKRQLEDPNLRGAIVLSYGSGNIPTKKEFLDVFRKAHSDGVVLVNVTQCTKGPVEMGIYETSAELLEVGFVEGHDITVSAAQCKLMHLLGDPDNTQKDVEIAFSLDIAGEQSISTYVSSYAEGGQLESSKKDENPPSFRIPGTQLVGSWKVGQLHRALLRLNRATVTTSSDAPLVVHVFVNLDPNSALDMNIPEYAGSFKKWATEGEKMAIFDVTETVSAIGEIGNRISFTLFIESAEGNTGSIKWESAELASQVRADDQD